MRYTLILCGVVCAGMCFAAEEKSAAGELDGKTFVGEVGKKGEAKADPDTFEFNGGNFLSTACVAYGFKATVYEAKAEGDKITFTASQANDGGEQMNWKGLVTGDTIEGTAEYVTKAGKEEYWFKGKLK